MTHRVSQCGGSRKTWVRHPEHGQKRKSSWCFNIIFRILNSLLFDSSSSPFSFSSCFGRILPSQEFRPSSTDATASPLAGTTPSSSGSTSLEACSVSITISSWSSSHPHASLFLGHRWLNHCMSSCLWNLKLQFECQNVFKCDNRTVCYISLVF